MTVANNSIRASCLEEKHMISILLYLGIHGPSRKIDIYQAVSTNPRMPMKLDKLESLGLINQDFDDGLRSTVVTLTPAGREIMEHLSAIESVLHSVQ